MSLLLVTLTWEGMTSLCLYFLLGKMRTLMSPASLGWNGDLNSLHILNALHVKSYSGSWHVVSTVYVLMGAVYMGSEEGAGK